ncbi:MAG: hydrolase 1, exosortase A system-associated [Rhodocyclales bacterium]|nr:hydrolase 1, exosortase A system-associated [Rhodocyclales bacterium]
MVLHDSPDLAPDLNERPVIFDCAGERLIGVIAQPAEPADTGVLIMVGGRQYRAGSHRQFVLLARRLASAGFSSLRFDFRGMGDSTGAAQSFEMADADIAAALATFKARCPYLKRVVLWGLCDAATAAVLYWQRAGDPFVAGLCLVNPWLRTEVSLARARVRHYYVERLLDPAFWRKLLSGGVGLRASIGEYLGQRRMARRANQTGDADFITQTLEGLRRFPGALLVVLSGRDLVAREFMDTLASKRGLALLTSAHHQRLLIPDADHTFSQSAAREAMEMAVLAWLEKVF